jgi:hypothetical protein
MTPFDANFEPPILTCRQHGPAYMTGGVCARCVDVQFAALAATQLTPEAQAVLEAAGRFVAEGLASATTAETERSDAYDVLVEAVVAYRKTLGKLSG